MVLQGSRQMETSKQDVTQMAGHTPSPLKEAANKQENLNLLKPLDLKSSLQETQKTKGHGTCDDNWQNSAWRKL